MVGQLGDGGVGKKYLVETGGVVAIDLADAEALYPTEDYRNVFALINSYSVPFTIHAGEAAGVESVRAALEMGAMQIGHGVRCSESR